MPTLYSNRLLADHARSRSPSSTRPSTGSSDGRDLVDAEHRQPRRGPPADRRAGRPDRAARGVREAPRRPRAPSAPCPAPTPAVPATPRRADGGDRAPVVPIAGAYLVDYLRAWDHGARSARRRRRVPGVRRPGWSPTRRPTDTTGHPADADRRPGREPDRRQPAAHLQPGRGQGAGRDPGLDVHPPEDHPAHHRRSAGRREDPAAVSRR